MRSGGKALQPLFPRAAEALPAAAFLPSRHPSCPDNNHFPASSKRSATAFAAARVNSSAERPRLLGGINHQRGPVGKARVRRDAVFRRERVGKIHILESSKLERVRRRVEHSLFVGGHPASSRALSRPARHSPPCVHTICPCRLAIMVASMMACSVT